jgi:hypothetical protein
VAISADGRTLAAWVAVRVERENYSFPSCGGTSYGTVEVRLGAEARGWRGVQVLGADAEDPMAAVGANGTAAVAWCSIEQGHASLYVSIATAGRSFGRARLVPTGGGFPVGAPGGLEVQPDGRVVLVWSKTLEYDLTPLKSRVEFALLRAHGGRPVIGTVSANVEGEVDLSAAETEEGDVLLALGQDHAEGPQSVAQLQPGARRFATPQGIEAAENAIIRGAYVSAGPGGAALVFAVTGEPADDETDENAMAELQPNGAFGPPVVVFRQPLRRSGDQFRPDGASVAFPAGGARVATWLNAFIGPPSGPLEGEVIGPEVVVASVRHVGATSFQAPVQLSVGPGRSGAPLIASAGTGTVVLWAQHEPGCKQRVYSAVGAVGTPLAQVRPLSGRYRPAKGECAEGNGQLALAGSNAGAIAGWVQSSTLHITTTAGGGSG